TDQHRRDGPGADQVDSRLEGSAVADPELARHRRNDDDPVVNRAVHESIAAMINKAHPGSATFREFAGLDHCWTRHPSLEASKDKCGQGEETRLVQDEILSFLSGSD